MGELGEKIKGETNEAIGKVKQESGNPETREEGRDQETKGEFQEEKGEVEGALGNDV
ncbi:MAG: CsbD family protein [Sphingomicrobium sp.]